MGKIQKSFLIFALITLNIGVFFGLIAGLQYVFPEFLANTLPFNKSRPLHVSFVVLWIVLAIFASIYSYLPNVVKSKLYSEKLVKIHFYLFIFIAIGILISLSFGYFSGREYIAYSPLLIIPLLISWIVFGINFFATIYRKLANIPVYIWMWATGIIFFILTLSEANLYLIPYFRDNHIRDITVQWKSYGSLVGSWNHLIYGTAIYLMSKIKNDKTLAFGFKPFFLYFLGLAGLLFGWAHHTYLFPIKPYIKHIAYVVSMTEWVVLAIIIWEWKQTLNVSKKNIYSIPYKFLYSTDYWIVLNLIFVLLLSIPALNLYTHGTQLTIAHAMGTTIGINTTLLLASVFYLISDKYKDKLSGFTKIINVGFYAYHISLFVFLITLILSGIERGKWMQEIKYSSFREMLAGIRIYSIHFIVSGVCLFISLMAITFPAIKILLNISHEKHCASSLAEQKID